MSSRLDFFGGGGGGDLGRVMLELGRKLFFERRGRARITLNEEVIRIKDKLKEFCKREKKHIKWEC